MAAIHRIAQIGLGRWGKTLASVIDKDPKFSLDWIHTRSPLTDERFQSRYETDIENILSAKPDGIILSTPLEGREIWIEKLLNANIPIFVEKPLSKRADISKQILARIEDSLVPVIVNYVHSCSPTIDWLQEIGIPQLGKIHSARITMGQPGGRYREEGVETLLLSHLLAIVYKLFPETSKNPLDWKKIFSTRDNHGQNIAIDIRCYPGNDGSNFNSNSASNFEAITSGSSMAILADLSYPTKTRLIEIIGDRGSIQAEFGGEGKITMALWDKDFGDSQVTQYQLDQSNNLGFVFDIFYHSITAYQTRKIGNLESLNQYSNVQLAYNIDTILENIQ
jgi:predicted dehydrogenase